ncbi:Uncharacterized protein PBTT_06245 [Plasmodiophora brassicae]
MTATTSPLSIRRLTVMRSGEWFVAFADGVCLYVGADAADAVLVDDAGRRRRVRPAFAPRTVVACRDRLQAAVALRNRHCPAPIALAHLADDVVDDDVDAGCVRWRRPPAPATSISSRCGRFHLSIVSRPTRICSIRFPFPVRDHPGAAVVVVVDQVLPVDVLPGAWRRVLALLLDDADDATDDDDICLDMRLDPIATPASPWSCERLADRCRSMQTLDAALPDDDDDDAVAVDWTRTAVWHVVDDLVLCRFHSADDSVLRPSSSSSLSLFEHVRVDGTTTLHSSDVAMSGPDPFSASHPIGASVRHAHRLARLSARRRLPAAAVARVPSSSSAPSSAVREACTVPSLGDFVAFADGRVTGRFFDRTLVHVGGEGDAAPRVVRRDGTTGPPARDTDQAYVDVCNEFRAWALLSVEERARRHAQARRRQDAVDDEIARSASFLGRPSALFAAAAGDDLDRVARATLLANEAFLERLSTGKRRGHLP